MVLQQFVLTLSNKHAFGYKKQNIGKKAEATRTQLTFQNHQKQRKPAGCKRPAAPTYAWRKSCGYRRTQRLFHPFAPDFRSHCSKRTVFPVFLLLPKRSSTKADLGKRVSGVTYKNYKVIKFHLLTALKWSIHVSIEVDR